MSRADEPGQHHGHRQHLQEKEHALEQRERNDEIPDDVRDVIGGLDGPVLVVDDRIETGWTMTVAARLLRQAGARAVLPLVLAAGAG